MRHEQDRHDIIAGTELLLDRPRHPGEVVEERRAERFQVGAWLRGGLRDVCRGETRRQIIERPVVGAGDVIVRKFPVAGGTDGVKADERDLLLLAELPDVRSTSAHEAEAGAETEGALGEVLAPLNADVNEKASQSTSAGLVVAR